MNDALSLLGFYFTLIGFIGGLFFTRLDAWYGSVRGFKGKVTQLTKRDEYQTANADVNGLAESKPFGSFIAVGLLLTGLMLLGFFVPINTPIVNPFLFIYAPILLSVAAYWVGGFVLIKKAETLIVEAREVIKSGLTG